ncbi:MAG: DNA-binding response regulator [Actinobacteria bacterium ATB1]|nr:DNA-binding response regulator [Actinobacteria bacterium ATB1]
MKDSTTVLIVDDEPSFTDALGIALKREGFRVHVAHDGVEAIEEFELRQPDIVLLDVMLPRMSGIDVCRELRTRSNIPIIMVSAKGEEVDAVVGLEVGADDYVTKPYGLRELIARMLAALRRAPRGVGPESPAVVSSGDVVVDPERHVVTVRGEVVQMTLKEFELLHLLVENAGRVVPREQILDRVWGLDYVGDTKTLDVHIRRLRSKIEEDVKAPRLIRTIRGLGYKFEAPVHAI